MKKKFSEDNNSNINFKRSEIKDIENLGFGKSPKENVIIKPEITNKFDLDANNYLPF